MELYPLLFRSIFKEKIWGGTKLNTILNKNFEPLKTCGETWEISDVEDSLSVVSNGYLAGKNLKEILTEFQDKLVGQHVYQQFGNAFPLLVKFIDAQQDLSVQVHPNDALAAARNQGFGKTEMWYVVQADEDAKIVSGFSEQITPQKYSQMVDNHTIMDVLNHEKATQDDIFFIPAGRIHTIGKGCLIAEIQQASDITYRIYDYDRRDADGNPRELHIEQALEAIDFEVYPEYKIRWDKKMNHANPVVSCPYFTAHIILANENMTRNYQHLDSFVILMCLEGKCKIHEVFLQKGDCILIPACIKTIPFTCLDAFKMLEVYIQ